MALITSAKLPNFCNQGLGQWFGIATLDGAKKNHFQKLVIGQGLGAGFTETTTQAFAMA